MSHIIAVSNQKGGVSKTTTTLSLGACLAELGRRILVVDLDSQANLTMAVGLDADNLPWTIVDLLDSENITLPEAEAGAIYATKMNGLEVLPADVRLAGIEHQLYERAGYEMVLTQVLAPWRDAYDYILLDCPPSLGTITLMALTAAERVLIPVQCEYYAARGLSRLLEIIAEVKSRTNPDLTYQLLAAMYDQRNGICRTVLEQLQSHFTGQIFDTVIGVDTRLRESPITGEPIILYAPNTRASQQYRQFAREFDAGVMNHKEKQI